MSNDLTALKTSIASLQTAVAGIQPVLQANADLTAKAITTIDGFLASIGNAASQADIDQLTASAQSALTTLQSDAQNVAAQNAALQAELDKVAGTSQPAPTPPSSGSSSGEPSAPTA